MVLHNRINKEELKRKLELEVPNRITFSFYKYTHLSNLQSLRDQWYKEGIEMGLMGRIYISYEGVNGQVSLPAENIGIYRSYIDSQEQFKGMRFNYAVEDDSKSFYKLTIKIRDKIVADGLDDNTFDVTNSGKHLSANEFNELTDNEETIIVDMRNHYEFEVGHFENAIHLDTDTFREALALAEEKLSDQKHKPVVMYCTGGIRCEKASAYFKHIGFKDVYQLDGGIIQYARDIKQHNLPNKFKGKNFVFDERLGERISEEIISVCHQCGKPADTHINCINEACHLLFIQCEDCRQKYNSCCSKDCQNFIALPIEEQIIKRKGIAKGIQVFKKGRSNLNFAHQKGYL